MELSLFFDSFSLFQLLAEENDVEGYKEHGAGAHHKEAVAQTLGGHAHHQEHGRAEQDGPGHMVNDVVGGQRLKAGIQLAEQDHAGGGGAGLHTVKGQEGLVLIAGKLFRNILFTHNYSL